MAEKRTKKVVFTEMLEIEEIKSNPEYKELIEKTIAQIDKKNSYKGETKLQKENNATMELIKEVLATINTKVRIGELQEANENLKVLSNQKMSALLKKLVDNNEVIKTIDKKVAYFELAE